MRMPVNPKTEGISLRTIHKWLIVGALILAGMLFCYTFQVVANFKDLAEASELQIELRKAARELMDASDYLTEKVQRFTINGDRIYMEEYFDEALENKHREEAVEIMDKDSSGSQAYTKLRKAMDESVALMDREYYAMRLVVEAKGYADYPEELKSVRLSSADMALSAEDKMRRATEMVLDDEYYDQKDVIRNNMKACLNELEEMAYDNDDAALEDLREKMIFLRVVIILQIVVVFFLVWLTARLGIHPVLGAVDHIRAGKPIPESGANEFRYLARTYNRMYEAYRKSLEHLNFKASHDELTGAYNRAGSELILSAIDLETTYVLMFDLDNFKGINDTYGHETGDKVLIKLVDILKRNFRSEDYICRVGGDEFVIFMVHANADYKEMIARKIDKINEELADTSDGLPATSISVGVVHGHGAVNAESLMRETDKAMYKSKKRGKSTYTFSGDNATG
jgi:diguanylate cyclase (GGDEF)-like protein